MFFFFLILQTMKQLQNRHPVSELQQMLMLARVLKVLMKAVMLTETCAVIYYIINSVLSYFPAMLPPCFLNSGQ